MNTADPTTSPGREFILSWCESEATSAIINRSRIRMEILGNTLRAYCKRLNDAEKARADRVIANIEAALRCVGGALR